MTANQLLMGVGGGESSEYFIALGGNQVNFIVHHQNPQTDSLTGPL